MSKVTEKAVINNKNGNHRLSSLCDGFLLTF
jgi:hypothetical protein